MKQIINVELAARKIDFVKCETDLLVLGVFSDAKKLDKLCKSIDAEIEGQIQKLIDLGDFKAKPNTTALIYTNKKIPAERILLTGLGEKKKADYNTLRTAAANAAKKAVDSGFKKISIAIHKAFGPRRDSEKMAQVVAEGAHFGAYRYDEFTTQDNNGRLQTLSVEVIDDDASKVKKLNVGIKTGQIIGNAQSYARTLSNRPANVINPEKLAGLAKQVATSSKHLKCTVLDEKQLAEKKMNAILAVGSGSKSKPRLIIIKYTPPKKPPKNAPTIALVGKAITFDSGGISIKPSANMEQMKMDKSGGVTVLAVVKAVAELRLPINLYAVIPSAENMPGGASCRPGDIVETFSGKTVEIQNTDAEGRMILCDALHYAVKQNCDVIIDLATLTGACMVALGKYMAGLMANDDALVRELKKAADSSGEKIWHLPSSEEYAEEIKSKIADLKNIGSKWGGACTAAAFLKQFIDEKKWAHLDIAGVDLFEKESGAAAEGSRGFAVRLLLSYLIQKTRKNSRKKK